MDMNGEQRIAADRQAVWQALNDLEVLQACIPGCESIEQLGENEHQLTLTAAVGPVKAKFKGRMRLADLDPPQAYRLAFEGQGGVAGFAKGEAQVRLEPDGEGTLMRYAAQAQVGGKLAQVGSRLIDAAAKKLADDFFAAFKARVAPAGAPEPAAEVAPAPAAGLPAWVWIVLALAAIVGAILLSR